MEHCKQVVRDGSCPWAVLSVWGFTDQPVSWLGAPPNAMPGSGGGNDYSIVILPDNDYMLMVASGPEDSFQTV